MEKCCVFCSDSLEDFEYHKLSLKGIETIKTISTSRNDGVVEKFSSNSDIYTHEKCRKKYCRLRAVPSTLPKVDEEVPIVSNITRSNVLIFKPKEQCLFCGEDVNNRLKLNNSTRICETKQIKNEILLRADERNDEWGERVKLRIQGMVSDIVAGDGRYHTLCHRDFYKGRDLHANKPRGRPSNSDNTRALDLLCEFMVNSGECQFSLSELLQQFEEFNGKLSQIHLKRELIRVYGTRIVFSEANGRQTIVSLKEKSDDMLYTEWKSSKMCTDRDMKKVVIETAIDILRQELSEFVYDNSYYEVGPNVIDDSVHHLPPLLNKLLSGLIDKKSGSKSAEKKSTFIVHTVMSAARPRSYISPLLLGVGVYVHRLFGSRQVVDVLSALGCSVSYHEVQRFESSAVMKCEENIEREGDALIQYVYDNADHNTATLDGSGSFHVLGGIECITPSTVVPRSSRIERLIKLPSAEQLASKTRVKLLHFCKTSQERSCLLQDLKSIEKNDIFSKMLTLDSLWLFGYAISVNPISSWNGYMQVAMEGSNVIPYNQTNIHALPFINSSPSHPDTIYTALVDAERRTVEFGQKFSFFTGDLPTYIKAREIVSNMQEKQQLMNVVVRLGGFHLLMNFLGAVGYIMSGSGIEELLSTIYARGSVDSMMNAKYYSRALRGHLLIHAALGKLIFSRIDLGNITEHEVLTLFMKFQNNQIDANTAATDKTTRQLMHHLSEAIMKIPSYGPTAKLWIQYFDLISLVKLFIRAERLGDWELHLSCIVSMLPIFHSAGHFKYAKYAHVYVQDMMQLKNVMPEGEYLRFTQGGFTIRRNEWYWSGCWSDLIIEQELMRSIKSSGGLTRGRGITESTVAQFISSQPACLEIIASIENFSGKRAENSEQHKEMRDTRMKRDKNDFETIYQWLEIHNPFICSPEHLVSLSTGTVAGSSVNCHNAREVGEAIIAKIVGIDISILKLQRKERVQNLTAVASSIKVRNENLCVDPTLLFSRMLCLTPSQSELKEYFSYELAPKAPSLFDTDNFMRKSCKSALATEIKRNVPCSEVSPPETLYVLDGGFLLHSVIWNKHDTYGEIINSYISYIDRHYAHHVTVVFDSYPSTPTTKDEEHRRRATSGTSAYIEFELSMLINVEQERFLKNPCNKSRLITFLAEALQTAGHVVKHAENDADLLIVQTAIEMSSSGEHVTIVGNDTDLIVLFIHHVTTVNNIHVLHPNGGKNHSEIYNIHRIQDYYKDAKSTILFAHAISGCDATSAIFGKGKIASLKLLMSDEDLRTMVQVFYRQHSTYDSVLSAGLKFMFKLYGANDDVAGLNLLRYYMYHRKSAAQPTHRMFNLARLPPTDDSAAQHIYRTYYQVQTWLGQQLSPLEWGWKIENGKMVPESGLLPPAPTNLLKLISCNCKKGCMKNCSCQRAGFKCSPICGYCKGLNCKNSEQTNEETGEYGVLQASSF